jgi:hypothetical protein
LSTSQFSERSTRKWAKRLDLPILRMWSHGNYIFDFVVPADGGHHRHGAVDAKTDLVTWRDDPVHYPTCRWLFPDDPTLPVGPPRRSQDPPVAPPRMA